MWIANAGGGVGEQGLPLRFYDVCLWGDRRDDRFIVEDGCENAVVSRRARTNGLKLNSKRRRSPPSRPPRYAVSALNSFIS